MFRSANPDNVTPVKLLSAPGAYGSDVTADPGNEGHVFLCESRSDAADCVAGRTLPDGTLPGLRLAAGSSVTVPGRDDNAGLKELWVVAAEGSQWVYGQTY